MLLGCASYSVASAIYLVATSVPMLALGRVAHGFALSNYTTAANTYISDIAPPKRRAEAIGFFAATADIGMISGPAIGFFIASTLGFHQLFYASAGMSLLALGCSVFARERRVHRRGAVHAGPCARASWPSTRCRWPGWRSASGWASGR